MDLLQSMNQKQVREFFSKNWITHDAMWFYHCMREFGPEAANRINQAAVRSMAAVEIHRILKLMGRENKPVTSYDELKEIIDTTYRLIQPDFMKLYYEFPEKNVFRGGFRECFAYEGVSKAGLAEVYQCGVLLRVKGWFETLGVKYRMLPDFEGCLMRESGECQISFHFELD